MLIKKWQWCLLLGFRLQAFGTNESKQMQESFVDKQFNFSLSNQLMISDPVDSICFVFCKGMFLGKTAA